MTWVAGLHGPFWTEERIKLLRDGHALGDSYTEIARKIGKGVTRNAVCGKIHRLGLSRPLSVIRANNARTKTRESLARNQTLATVVRNQTARRPDQPLPVGRDDKLGPTATIDTLTGHSCRWPIGDPRAAGFGFCGRHKDDLERPYCEAHAKVARGQPATKAQRQAAAKARQAKTMRRAA